MFKKKASEDSKPLMVLEGSGGSVELWRTKVVIKHKGVVSKMAMGLTGDKDVYLSGITGIQIKKPTEGAGIWRCPRPCRRCSCRAQPGHSPIYRAEPIRARAWPQAAD